VEEVFAGGGAGAMAFASHAVKAGIRLGVNSSPEPASNIIVSLLEDALVAGVVILALEHPVPAAIIAVLLLAAGGALVVFLAKRIRRGVRYVRERLAAKG
jgi:ABC-type sugar transport system substrate-binding protein